LKPGLLTFAMVAQGVVLEVPLFESLPAAET